MIADQRKELILRELRARGSVSVSDFAQRHDVARITVRRDLAALADEGLLARTHGGAVPAPASAGRDGQDRKGAQARRSRSAADVAAGSGRGGSRGQPIVGMIVPSASYYYPLMIKGAEEAASRMGARLVLGISNYSPVEERRQVDRLVANRVDGLLITPSEADFAEGRTLEVLAGAKVPVVVMERSLDEAPPLGCLEGVRTDHAAGAELAVAHLAGLGHRRVLLAVRSSTPTSRWIAQGYARAVARRGLEPGGSVIELPMIPAGELPDMEPFDRLLDSVSGDSCAVIVHTDEDAAQLLRRAQERGVEVPEQLSIVAYDDEIAAFAPVPLTAVSPPKHELGLAAVTMCLERLAYGGVDSTEQSPLRRLKLVPALKIRESTRPRNVP